MNNRRHASALLPLVLTFLLHSGIAAAQGPAAITDLRNADNASLRGTVKDPSSAVIPGVKVVLTNTQTGAVYTRQTNDVGNYEFPDVPPGYYSLSGDLSGFSSEIRNNIQVVASNQVRVDLVLRIGGTPAPIIEGTRLVWTAAPGTGSTYVIERSGPGLTQYTQVAGPISEPTYVVDTKGSDFAGGETYNYRIRAIDSAGNKGEPSNPVRVRFNGVRNLPIVGNNVLELLAVIPGFANSGLSLRPDDVLSRSFSPESTPPESISMVFTGTSGRMLSFIAADGSQSFAWGCPDCSFVVGPGGVGPVIASSRGAIFKLSADGSSILVTCRAVKCDVLTARQIETEKGIIRASGSVAEATLASDQTMTIPATLRAFFSLKTR